MKIPPILFLSVLLALPLLGATAGDGRETPDRVPIPLRGEDLHYRWQLGKNLVGLLARLLLPGLPDEGEGRLTLEPAGPDTLKSELLITSEKTHEGDFWRYGSRIHPEAGTTVEAWSAYRWRGKDKSKREEIGQQGVFDVASAIYRLRQDPPSEPRQLEIWSDGKIYPVVAVPMGWEEQVVSGRKVPALHLTIRGREVEGMHFWKGRLDLWLAHDAASTPVVIVIERRMATVRLELVAEQLPGTPIPASPQGDERTGKHP